MDRADSRTGVTESVDVTSTGKPGPRMVAEEGEAEEAMHHECRGSITPPLEGRALML